MHDEPIHKLAGTYHQHGTIKADNGQTVSFKCARVRRDGTGPKAQGFIPCVLNIMVNPAAYALLTATTADDDLPPLDESETATDASTDGKPQSNPRRKPHAAAVG